MGGNNEVYAGVALDMEELGLINGRKKLRIARKRKRKIEEREYHVKRARDPRKACVFDDDMDDISFYR